MQIALIGLGKMGLNLALNMQKHKHEVFAFDLNQQILSSAKEKGIKTASSIEELVHSLHERKVIWLMIPAGQAIESTCSTGIASPGSKKLSHLTKFSLAPPAIGQ